MKLLKRKHLLAGGVLLCVAAVLALFLPSRPDELARWKTAMRVKGEKFSLAEVAPKFSRDKQEFEKQFKSAVDGLVLYPVGPGMMTPMQSNAPGCAAVAWQQPYAAETARTNYSWDALAEQMADSEEALRRLHELLRHVPAGTAFDYADPVNLGSPNFVTKRKAAQTLTSAVLNDLHRGALDNALTNLHTLLALARLHEEEGTLVSQMIRVAITGLGTSATWEALQSPGWNDAQLAALDAEWARVELLRTMDTAFQIERAWIVALYQHMRTNAVRMRNITGSPTTGGAAQMLKDSFYTPLWQRAWSRTDELLFLRAMQPIGEAVRLGITNRSWLIMSARLRAAGESPLVNLTAFDRFRYEVADGAVPNWERAMRHLMRNESQRQMARAAIALARHQLKHGRPPETLAKLVPEFLAEAPVDCMTGRPLLYQLNGDGSFTLYSVGENGRDDAGTGDDLIWPKAK